MLSKTLVMGRRASNGPRSMTVQDEVSVNSASANSSGVATFGPIDCWGGKIVCVVSKGALGFAVLPLEKVEVSARVGIC